MDEKTYAKLAGIVRSYQYGPQILYIVNRISTALVYLIYPFILITLALSGEVLFWQVLLVPGVSFILVSLSRNYINAPRPYEVLDIAPIIEKNTKGRSFPSRHVFSAFIIATSLYHVSVTVGIAIMVIGIILAIVRVVGGVHFPRDVIAGALLGILLGKIGFYLSDIIRMVIDFAEKL